MMNFFDDLGNMGATLTVEQKENLKEMGEKFYGSIDMEKYKPVPADEGDPNKLFTENDAMKIKYCQLKVAMNSGLMREDLTEEELTLLDVFEANKN